jgi:hypothetical protein
VSGTKVFAVVRDTLCLLVGLGGLIFQQVTGKTNTELIAAWLMLLGFAVPGATALRHLARAGRTETPPTPEPSSPSSAPSSPSP